MNGIFVVGADCLAPASLGQNHFLTTNCTPARNDSSFFFKLVDLSYIMYLATSAEWCHQDNGAENVFVLL